VSDQRPGPDGHSDDTREREPVGDGADLPAAAGTRSDHAGTSGTLAGVTPGGSEAVRDIATRAQDREGEPPAGQATGAGGGYGVGSQRGSGGSGEATEPAGNDDQTDWLRDASGDAAGETRG
jgi:hypothetical protein